MGKVATVRTACSTSNGTQSFTNTDLGGLTPGAALFFLTFCSSDNTPAAHAGWGVGAATSTSERWTVASVYRDSIAGTQGWRRGAADNCIMLLNPTTDNGAVLCEADFSQFVANGVEVNWSTAPGTAYLMHVVLFADVDDAYAGSFLPNGTQDASVDVTDPGFWPNFMFTSGCAALLNDTASAHAEGGIGFVVNDGSTTEASYLVTLFEDGTGTAHQQGACSNQYGYIALSLATLKYAIEFSGFDSSGFTATTRLGAGDVNDAICYLAISFGGSSPKLDVWAGGFDTRTTQGSQSITAPGFKPQAVFLGPNYMTAWDTHHSDSALAGCRGFGLASGVDDEFSGSNNAQEGVATTFAQSLSDDQIGVIEQHDGSTGIIAYLESLNTDGFTLYYSTADGTARKWPAAAIEAMPGGERGVGRGVMRGVGRGV